MECVGFGLFRCDIFATGELVWQHLRLPTAATAAAGGGCNRRSVQHTGYVRIALLQSERGGDCSQYVLCSFMHGLMCVSLLHQCVEYSQICLARVQGLYTACAKHALYHFLLSVNTTSKHHVVSSCTTPVQQCASLMPHTLSSMP